MKGQLQLMSVLSSLQCVSVRVAALTQCAALLGYPLHINYWLKLCFYVH